MADDRVGSEARPIDALFLSEMPRLKRRLTWRTGSIQTAEDLLHDIWLRLFSRRTDNVANPASYLSRTADNLAIDDARARARILPASEVDILLQIPDEAPTPERIVAARQALQTVTAALRELPERRRRIFVEARLGGERYAAIAARHGITTRTVENEVRRVLDHFERRLDRRED